MRDGSYLDADPHAVLMHRLWVTGETYDWQRQPQAA